MKLIEFWAEWCAPCKRMAPVVEQVAMERGWELVKISVDDSPEEAAKWEVKSIPTLLLVDDSGNVITRLVGAMNKVHLDTALGV